MTSAASVERIHYWAEPLLVEVRVKEISTHPPASLTVEGNNQTPSIVELPATKDNYRSASGRSGCETVACFQLLPASTRSRAPGHQRSYLATTWQNSHHCHFKFSAKKYLRYHNNSLLTEGLGPTANSHLENRSDRIPHQIPWTSQ